MRQEGVSFTRAKACCRASSRRAHGDRVKEFCVYANTANTSQPSCNVIQQKAVGFFESCEGFIKATSEEGCFCLKDVFARRLGNIQLSARLNVFNMYKEQDVRRNVSRIYIPFGVFFFFFLNDHRWFYCSILKKIIIIKNNSP